MADLRALRALHYDLEIAGPLEDLVAPPYDVIDPEQRARLAQRATHNVVRIDLPNGPRPYDRAAELVAQWRAQGALARDDQPALWALVQSYTTADGERRTRRGVLARVHVEDYGPGRIRPHERTHPGPKQDRLALTRATRLNLSPIFSLYSDPDHAVWRALGPQVEAEAAWASVHDDEGTQHTVWRIADPRTIAAVADAVRGRELLIADGHHRYETSRVYADEIGGEGAHRFVLMCLVALEDPGLTVFPTHRLLRELGAPRRVALRRALEEIFDVREVALDELVPAPAAGRERLALGYLDAEERRPLRLELRDTSAVDEALADRSPAYRRLDSAVLEALVLKRGLGMDDEDIAHLRGLDYARSQDEAIAGVQRRDYQAAFFLAPPPIDQVREIAAAGESMPPKSTFFFPKLLTGVLFNPLWGE